MKLSKQFKMKRPDMRAYFRYRIEWKNKGLLSSLAHPGLPEGVRQVKGDVADRRIEVFAGDRIWSWQGGRYASRKTNGNYPLLMPVPIGN
jgi:hypothetical protein